MFDLFRSQRKSVKYVLGAMMTLVGVSMVITLVPGLFSTPTTDLNNPVLAEIGDERVTIRDVQVRLSQMIPPGQDPQQMMGLLAGQAIEDLIAEKALFAEADRLGLRPNERQFAEWMRKEMPGLFPGGRFDAAQYQAGIQQQFRMTVPEFEQRLLTELTVQSRLQSMVVDSVVVTEDDVRSAFVSDNETAQVDWVVVSAILFRDQVEVDDESVQEFFNSNQFRYRTQETRSVKHVTFVDQPAPAVAEISDIEIRNFYDQNRFRFETPAQVHPRHILFLTVDQQTGASISDEDKAAKRALAEEVLEKLRGGGDFAELAAQYSEDAGNKEEGGDLGFVGRGQLGTASFEDPTFALEPGEMSDVVETDFGFHIIEMIEKRAANRRPLEEVREEIVGDLRAERSALAQQEQTDQALTALRNSTPDTIDDVAAGLGFTLVTLEDFQQGIPPTQLSRSPQLLSAVFTGAAGEVIPHADASGMVAIMITDIKPQRDMTFDEAKDRARTDYVTAESRKLAEARVAELEEKARASTLAEAAQELDLQYTESDPFTRSGQVVGFTTAENLSAAFSADAGSLHGPVPISMGFGMFVPKGVQQPDMDSFAAQAASIRERLTEERRNEAFEIFRDAVLSRYEEDGTIYRYDARIEQFINLNSQRL